MGRTAARWGSVLSGVWLAGCATLSRGTTDEVVVISDPPGAAVSSTTGVGCAATPCTLDVARDAEFSVTIAKAGYAAQTVAVATRLSSTGAAVATENVSTAGLGLVVDAATGATLEHTPNPVKVTLASLAPPSPPHAGRRRSPPDEKSTP